jgi:hypothetical protein
MGRRVAVDSSEPGENKGLPLLGDGSPLFLILREKAEGVAARKLPDLPGGAEDLSADGDVPRSQCRAIALISQAIGGSLAEHLSSVIGSSQSFEVYTVYTVRVVSLYPFQSGESLRIQMLPTACTVMRVRWVPIKIQAGTGVHGGTHRTTAETTSAKRCGASPAGGEGGAAPARRVARYM